MVYIVLAPMLPTSVIVNSSLDYESLNVATYSTSFQDYALYQERNTDLYCRVALATLLVYYTG